MTHLSGHIRNKIRKLERIISIYTKTGDDGTTSLARGERRAKSDVRIMAIGSIDELNACIGVVIATLKLRSAQAYKRVDTLKQIQQHLFGIGASLALTEGHAPGVAEIQWMEQEIDRFETQLPELKNFILPGGCRGAAELHRTRTVCRRTERDLLHLQAQEKVESGVTIYLNRLSDLLFMMARDVNKQRGVEEECWTTE
ncbi:cob(I)yrinic acid a,c-diamide adenosyltransferase [Solemya velum gill symbiont]|uniref:cob(I)yrinic acid a,c-diamide adenosyltransferase n=1 Tax=Solemya velum gill symbiont TaxID=2340 RepID=UPI00277B4C40|nr:cob(I)yrinic acid a,c-diamide adenosyltransferase [Solemya velum gill symbiont]